MFVVSRFIAGETLESRSHDMHGNVSEWCFDRKTTGSPEQVARGGIFTDVGSNCQAESRVSLFPSSATGFWIALSPSIESSFANPHIISGQILSTSELVTFGLFLRLSIAVGRCLFPKFGAVVRWHRLMPNKNRRLESCDDIRIF